MSDVAVDPDKWKSNPGEFRNAEWHFVDTPLGKTYDAHRDCPFSDCVTDRVTQIAEIVKTETNAPRRKEALIYLIHFVGDIHQPLKDVLQIELPTPELPPKGGWFDVELTDGSVLHCSQVLLKGKSAELIVLPDLPLTIPLSAVFSILRDHLLS